MLIRFSAWCVWWWVSSQTVPAYGKHVTTISKSVLLWHNQCILFSTLSNSCIALLGAPPHVISLTDQPFSWLPKGQFFTDDFIARFLEQSFQAWLCLHPQALPSIHTCNMCRVHMHRTISLSICNCEALLTKPASHGVCQSITRVGLGEQLAQSIDIGHKPANSWLRSTLGIFNNSSSLDSPMDLAYSAGH